MPFHVDAWVEAFSFYGIQVAPVDLYLLEGIKSPEVVDRLCRTMNLPLTTLERRRIVDVKHQLYKERFRVVPISVRLL